MSDLVKRQSSFSQAVAKLINYAIAQGYDVTLGEAWRSNPEARRLSGLGLGILDSKHCKRLAIDLILFRDGVYLTKSEDYAVIGAYWEVLGGIWGGRFKRADGNHFEWR